MSRFRKHLLATAVGMAATVGLASSASATLLPFGINPNSLTSVPFPISGYGTNVQATDINGTSVATIYQTGLNTQTENGIVQVSGLTNNGITVTRLQSGIEATNGTAVANEYDLFIVFTANVTGITGFTPGQNGTMGAGDFTYTVYADTQLDDVMTPGTFGAAPTDPTLSNFSNDLVLAQGSSLSGSAGFQANTGGPIFSVTANFDICNGTAGFASRGGVTVAAAGCGTFNALNYFVDPSPFYSLQFTSTTAGSAQNIGTDGVNQNATLNGIVTDTNFLRVPEPSTLALLGIGLIGLGASLRKRVRRA